MKSKLAFAIGIALAIAIPVISFAASFGTQNFFYAPGNVITPLSGFTTSWTSSSFSTTSATYFMQSANPLVIGSSFASLPNTILNVSSSTNTFMQSVFTNTSPGNAASTDIVLNNGSSTQTSYFGEFGINGAGYNQAAFSGEGANDSYFMSSDASVDIETASTTCSACAFKVFTGGTTAAQLRLSIASSGVATLVNGFQSQASSTETGNFTVSGTANQSTTTISNNALVITGTGGGGEGQGHTSLDLQRTDAGSPSTQINFVGSGGTSANHWSITTDAGYQFTPSSTWSLGYSSGVQTYQTQAIVVTSGLKVRVGTTSPVANFQATTNSSNATSTIELGKSGNTTNGTCLKLYRTDGTAIYAYVLGGATTFTLSTTACATVTGF